MFYGEFQHTLDPKGRMIVPSAYREELRGKFMIAKGLEQCLFIFSMPQWNSLVDKLQTLPLSNTSARDFNRYFFSSAAECEMDGQSRILVPPGLRKYASLEKDISIIGVGSRVEVWDKNKWETYTQSENLSPDNITNTFALLGI